MRMASVAMLFLLSSSNAQSQVEVFDKGPDVGSPIISVKDPAVVADFAVIPNVRGLAANLIRERPESVVVQLPGLPSVTLELRRGVPLEGFDVTKDGALIIAPDASDAELSFNLYAVAHGKELSLIVHRGRMTGSLTGSFERPRQSWDIVESGGQLVLRDIDTAQIPAEPDDRVVSLDKSELRQSALGEKRAIDGGGTIDVVVLHTANAEVQAGGLAPMDDLIRGSFVDLQLALDNSQAYRVHINHVLADGPDAPRASALVAYDESPGIANAQARWFAHRTWARTNPQAVAIRNQYQADLMVMMVGDAGTCGVAYTQRPNCGAQTGEMGCGVGAGYAEFAISVLSTRPACGLSTHTMVHEVGHQFGMEHDPINGSVVGNASFPWSYGFAVSTPDNRARTVMAYEIMTGANANCPNGCPIQLQYSNPRVEFQSLAGVTAGTLAGDAQGRHSFNARTAMLYAPVMEAFRGPIAPDNGVFGHGFEPLPDIVCNPAIWPNCPP